MMPLTREANDDARTDQRIRSTRVGETPSVATHAGAGKFIVGGNWKCNGTAESVKALVKELNSGKIDADVDVYVAPPFVFLPRVQADLNTKRYNAAAQNCWVAPARVHGRSQRRYVGRRADSVGDSRTQRTSCALR